MKKLVITTIALATIVVVVRAKVKKQSIVSYENDLAGENVSVTSAGIISTL